MRSVFLIGGSIAGMFFGEIYPAIILALILRHLGTQLNASFQITKSTRYKLIKSTIQIMISIAKADGVFTKSELNYIKQFLSYHFKVAESEFSWYLQFMKKETYKKNIPLNSALKTIYDCSNLHEKRYFRSCFSELAKISSPMTIKQQQLISVYSKYMGIKTEKKRTYWKKPKVISYEHYELLESTPDMDINDIRQKYIQMAKFYHPDRYRDRPTPEQVFANKKMQQLNEAWHKIVKEKRK